MTTHSPNQSPLSVERLMDLIDAYGADLARFPNHERAQAEALLASSEAAQKAWQDAKSLDALLGELPSEAPSAALMQALDAIPARHGQKGVLVQFMPKKSRALSSFAAAAAVMLGVVSGLQQAENEQTYVTPMGGEQAAYDSEDDLALAELSELAFGAELLSDLGYFEGDME